jgi:hypothetical protein
MTTPQIKPGTRCECPGMMVGNIHTDCPGCKRPTSIVECTAMASNVVKGKSLCSDCAGYHGSEAGERFRDAMADLQAASEKRAGHLGNAPRGSSASGDEAKAVTK